MKTLRKGVWNFKAKTNSSFTVSYWKKQRFIITVYLKSHTAFPDILYDNGNKII